MPARVDDREVGQARTWRGAGRERLAPRPAGAPNEEPAYFFLLFFLLFLSFFLSFFLLMSRSSLLGRGCVVAPSYPPKADFIPRRGIDELRVTLRRTR